MCLGESYRLALLRQNAFSRESLPRVRVGRAGDGALPEPVELVVEFLGGLAPLLISARSKAALAALAQSWREQLIDAPQAAGELAQGAARRRDHHRHPILYRDT